MASGSLEFFENRLMSMASKPDALTSVTSMTLTLRGSCASVLLVLSDHAARSAYFDGFFVAGASASSGWTLRKHENRPMVAQALTEGVPLVAVDGCPTLPHAFLGALGL